VLTCLGCGRDWRVTDGLPRLVDDAQVRGLDRLARAVYDRLGVFHDPAVEFLLPLLQWESIDRNTYIRRLDLPVLATAHRRVRILEVGIGGGANVPLIERAVPARLDYELWGLDLSDGMLAQCRIRLARRRPRRPVRLVLGDAHSLPFDDATFDRVFHVGGLNGYNDPRRGLAEMARVARPGSPIVVVDEQLDPRRPHGLWPRLMFQIMTFADPSPYSPRALLPANATGVIDEQASRFYYCLTFRMPVARAADTPGTRGCTGVSPAARSSAPPR
jgi:ubiquinone/menaquinone biosynthesis C-methylase UbiE